MKLNFVNQVALYTASNPVFHKEYFYKQEIQGHVIQPNWKVYSRRTNRGKVATHEDKEGTSK